MEKENGRNEGVWRAGEDSVTATLMEGIGRRRKRKEERERRKEHRSESERCKGGEELSLKNEGEETRMLKRAGRG